MVMIGMNEMSWPMVDKNDNRVGQIMYARTCTCMHVRTTCPASQMFLHVKQNDCYAVGNVKFHIIWHAYGVIKLTGMKV